ncbi:OB-fold domain-containing protein [Nocardia sp. NPDC050718]|uniref:Zn-ribbon domain-containing OB-fold protein n=1 Tax=Nocardia sp. NPDC050718 TaxID=3155788 RepID=UPI0033D813EB
MTTVSAEPALYDVDDDGVPRLFGLRDSSGFVSYPFQPYGSENNGDHGELVRRVALAGTGTITAVTTVQLAPHPSVDAPYTLASIVLDEGPMVRAVLIDADDAGIGTRVRAVTVPIERGGEQVAEVRFLPIIQGDR